MTVFTTFWNGGQDGDRFEGMPIRRVPDISHAVGRYAAILDFHYMTWGRNLLGYQEDLRQCDIIHALAPLSSAKALTSMGLPLLTHFHHYEAILRPRDLLYKPFHHRLERQAYRQSTLVAALSRHGAQNLENAFRVPNDKIRIIPDGVDLDRFSQRFRTRPGTPLILHVGGHERRKGLDYLLRALRLLIDRGIDFSFVSVGAGPETARLRRLAHLLGLETCVDFAGYVDPLGDRLPKIYRDAEVLVNPSLEEGFGMVLAEAMASGVPVVATNCGAIPEVVGDAGVLVPPKDPVSLANALQTVLSDSTLSESLGTEGRLRVESFFSWDSVADKTVQAYEEAISIVGQTY